MDPQTIQALEIALNGDNVDATTRKHGRIWRMTEQPGGIVEFCKEMGEIAGEVDIPRHLLTYLTICGLAGIRMESADYEDGTSARIYLTFKGKQ